MSRLLATAFGIGWLRPAPGTWASLAALPAAWGLLALGGPFLLLGMAAAALALTVWAAAEEARRTGDHDPSHVVLDEVGGQWVALLPVGFGAWRVDAPYLDLWPGWVAAFALFRLLDVWKPWVIGRADRRRDAIGVMLDDALAGLGAALGVVALAALFHLWLLA